MDNLCFFFKLLYICRLFLVNCFCLLQGPKHKVEMLGRYHPTDGSAAVSECLKVVEVKCQVVDEKVQEVLKFLCTFNICKWTNDILDALYISEIFVSNVGTEAANKLRYVFKKHWMFQVQNVLSNETSTAFSGAGLAWGTKINSVQLTSIFHKFLHQIFFPQNCVEVFKLISY